MYVVIFDGICNLCSGFMRFVYKRDKNERFKFAWIQSEQGKALLRRYGISKDKIDTIIYIDHNRVYTKSTAFLRIVKYLNYPWPLLQAGYLIPVYFRDKLYDWVAQNRYRWFGKKDSCIITNGEIGDRFL
ncbi:MAG: thiol-disulfide oxidoreductase DCC family protein [Calditrichaceae bacterium]|nr:thiol-disulfide oxidoreductase DCC family protein [Calditrichaceae bacterium]MBN2710029.1 thiol-disulfide oxidoreductase DCC family protein [Calditrichaceae bacterium]RQV92129.1 MAG: thiol-disulfide oxidoreductase DCC family protein [Calditrichota bacterium]